MTQKRRFSVEMRESADAADRLRALVEAHGARPLAIDRSLDGEDPDLARFLSIEVEGDDLRHLQERLGESEAIADILPEPGAEPSKP